MENVAEEAEPLTTGGSEAKAEAEAVAARLDAVKEGGLRAVQERQERREAYAVWVAAAAAVAAEAAEARVTSLRQEGERAVAERQERREAYTAWAAAADAAGKLASLRQEGERAVAERLARREAFAARATEVSDLAWEAARAGVGSIPIS